MFKHFFIVIDEQREYDDSVNCTAGCLQNYRPHPQCKQLEESEMNTEKELIAQIDTLLNSNALTTAEKPLLQTAHADLAKKAVDTRVAQQLKVALAPLARQQKLSPQMVAFFTWLSKNYMGFGQRGMGLTELRF
jgi:hypothetical protein